MSLSAFERFGKLLISLLTGLCHLVDRIDVTNDREIWSRHNVEIGVSKFVADRVELGGNDERGYLHGC